MIELGGSGGRGYLALPESGNGHGVLLLHAWWGLNTTFMQMCDGLASEGFVALAPDLYGNHPPVSTIEEAEKLAQGRERETSSQAVSDGLERLAVEATGSVAAIGFSLGAMYAMAAADERPDQVAAVVCFYGTGEPGGVGRAPVLGHFAAGDPWEEEAWVAEVEQGLRAAGRKVIFHRYEGVQHWFAEPDRPEFAAEAAELSWQRTLEFLHEELGARTRNSAQ